ncbi:MAG: hypothetical protein MUF43_12185, partial [Flavobacterium sp.]|nr:hypothetical protein [Flavobacterium sp.]
MDFQIDSVFIVGSGNVAFHLGKELFNEGVKITGVFSRNKDEAQKLASKEKRSLIARTLYTMGDSSFNPPQAVAADDHFKAAKTQQKYLLKAVEMDSAPWSQKAQEQLLGIYSKTWNYVSDIKPSANVQETKARR